MKKDYLVVPLLFIAIVVLVLNIAFRLNKAKSMPYDFDIESVMVYYKHGYMKGSIAYSDSKSGDHFEAQWLRDSIEFRNRLLK